MANENNLVARIKSDQEEKQTQSNAQKLGVKYFDARYINVPIDLLMQFGERRSSDLSIVPISSDGTTLNVGLTDINAATAKKTSDLISELGYVIEPHLISPHSYRNIASQFSKIPKTPSGRPRVITGQGLTLPTLKIKTLDEISPYLSQKDTEVVLANMLAVAVATRASDIHLEPRADGVSMGLRIDGVLHPVATIPLKNYAELVTRIKFYSHMKLNIETPQDGRIQASFDKKEVDFRIGTMPSIQGESITIRVLRTEGKLLNLEELGMHKHDLGIVTKHIKRPKGMILATGPTGSGKTTTLYSILNILNTPNVSIVTIEDPVEYLLPGITQSQVDEKSGYDFPNALRASLRHDPDIIMIGEIRDAKTAEVAFRAALTGHIALSTFHAVDAVAVIPSMVEMGVKTFLASSALSIIIAQRLVRKLCQFCKTGASYPKETTAEVSKKLVPVQKSEGADETKYKFYKSVGCKECQGLGYLGQVGIYEILEITPEIIKLSNSNAPLVEIQKKAVALGMTTMEQDGYYKASKGITTLEEIWRVIGSE